MNCRKCKEKMYQDEYVYGIFVRMDQNDSLRSDTDTEMFYVCSNDKCEHYQLVKISISKKEL